MLGLVPFIGAVPSDRGCSSSHREARGAAVIRSTATSMDQIATSLSLLAMTVLSTASRPTRGLSGSRLCRRYPAAVSARVGGWYGYRASKAALTMLIRTPAIGHRLTRKLG
ncbi:MAG TPA: hypothetical protein DDZ81_03305 [Acetobacteraceae bacterium]|nr:hypothetical protein [Acetobacteraceae bacterium]